jgi:DNA-binding transcriptional regulator YiaG
MINYFWRNKMTFEEKKKRLIAAGWQVGNTEDFLELTPEESAYIDIKIALSDHFKALRLKRKLSQIQTARLLKTSQSRVAKMEKGDPSVSADLLLKALFSLGLKKKNLGRILS